MSILKLKGKPLLNQQGVAITNTDSLNAPNNKLSNRNKSTLILYTKTDEPIEAASCVFVGANGLSFASAGLDNTHCDGISLYKSAAGTQCGYRTSGLFESNTLTFTAPFNQPVYVSVGGRPSQTPPKRGYIQIIGFTVSANSFQIRIQEKIRIVPNPG